MGRRRLHPELRSPAAHRRCPRRTARRPPRLHDRPGDLRRPLCGVRAGAVARRAGGRAGDPGRGRGGPRTVVPAAAPGGVHRSTGPGPRARPVGCHRRGRRGQRARHRRRAGQRMELAGGVFPEPAVRGRCAAGGAAVRAGHPAPAAGGGPGRPGAFGRRARCAHRRPGGGRAARLGPPRWCWPVLSCRRLPGPRSSAGCATA
jgi:hypothetical protein